MNPLKCTEEEERLAALYRYEILDTELDEDYEDITRLISQICHTPVAIISLVDRDRQWFKSEIGMGIRETPLDHSICAHAILQQGLFIVPDTLNDPRFANNPLVTGDPHLRFYAGELLETTDGHALGTLCVLDYVPRDLTPEQREVLRVLARQVMVQIELRLQLKERDHIIAERRQFEEKLAVMYRREKHIAETLQRSWLMTVSQGDFPGLCIETFYEAALDEALVGGDFFDAFAMGGNVVALSVGDVSGKGLAAASRIAEVKFALRAFLHSHTSPSAALAKLNNFICHTLSGDHQSENTFIVLLLAIVDISAGTVVFASAGGEPPRIHRVDNTLSSIHTAGQPLGILPDASYEEESDTLRRGDTIIMFTDGITEARRDGRFFGEEAMAALIQNTGAASCPDVMAQAIYQGALAFAGGPLKDDACLLLARCQ